MRWIDGLRSYWPMLLTEKNGGDTDWMWLGTRMPRAMWTEEKPPTHSHILTGTMWSMLSTRINLMTSSYWSKLPPIDWTTRAKILLPWLLLFEIERSICCPCSSCLRSFHPFEQAFHWRMTSDTQSVWMTLTGKWLPTARFSRYRHGFPDLFLFRSGQVSLSSLQSPQFLTLTYGN